MEEAENPMAVEVRTEYARIMTDKTHPMHAGYKAGDKKVDQYIDELYRRAYGTEPGKMPGLTMGGEGESFVSRPAAVDPPPLVSNDGLSFTSDGREAARYERARSDALSS